MFQPENFLGDAVMARLTQTRIDDPEFPHRVAQQRRRRERIAPKGKLNILAADHPARRVTKAIADPLGMADRRSYLARIVRVLQSETVDGLMATMDILEELFILDGFLREAGGASLLDGKLLIASLNRGGLAGSSWELDDPVTGPTAATCSAWWLDGAKFLLRIADSDPASLKTMLAAAHAITECNEHGIPMFLEPLPVTRNGTAWSVEKEVDALARIAGVASALGDSSRHLWLKLPYCAGFEKVARATTLPILLLGGESAGDPKPFLDELSAALDSGANIRGALVGRNVLFPGDADPQAMAEAVGGIVHQGWSVKQALASLAAHRGVGMDLFGKR
ncbi:MAG: hypothetical protein R2729_07845 [Bryobacteraceae bacterium]